MRIILSVIFLLCSAFSFSQQLELKELLQEAETKYYNTPEHSIRITEYVLTQNKNDDIAAQAYLILAKSYFVQDKDYEATKAFFDAQKLANKTNDTSLKIKTKLTGIQLLQKLALNTISDELKSEANRLTETLPSSSDAELVENKLILLGTELALHNGDFSNAQKLYSALNTGIIAPNSNYNLRVKLGKAQLKYKQSKLEEALEMLQQLPPEIPKYFQTQKLNLLGSIKFDNKQYAEAITHWNQAKEIAIQISNNELANQSLDRLIQVYLIQENSKKYLDFKQESNLLTSELITDRVRAVNFAYNSYENLKSEFAHKKFTFAQKQLYLGATGFIFLILVALGLNYYYRMRTKEYYVFKRLISPAPATSQKRIVEKSLVSEEIENHILQELETFEASNDFTRPDMSIAFLAARLNTNTKYLSDVIKRHKEKNFNRYINTLRIEYIIEKLRTDPIYLNYKISYLAEESGFSSHSSFATVFKSVTQISPTKFIALLQKERNYE